MAIWRVMGISAADERSQVMFVRTNLKERAVELAGQAGVCEGIAQPARAEEALGQTIHPDPDAFGPGFDRLERLAESGLLRRPIVTIAAGVFLGMLLFGTVSLVVAGIFGR